MTIEQFPKLFPEFQSLVLETRRRKKYFSALASEKSQIFNLFPFSCSEKSWAKESSKSHLFLSSPNVCQFEDFYLGNLLINVLEFCTASMKIPIQEREREKKTFLSGVNVYHWHFFSEKIKIESLESFPQIEVLYIGTTKRIFFSYIYS